MAAFGWLAAQLLRQWQWDAIRRHRTRDGAARRGDRAAQPGQA
jgi:hypothetical protein